MFCRSCRSFLEAPDVGKLARPRRRLLAAFLDSVFQDGGSIGSILGPLLIGSGAAHAVVAVLSTTYWILTLYLWTKGTTPAKRALDMDVIREDGEPAGFFRMAFRETIGKVISWMVLGLGILSVPIDRNHQGWHDKMAGTFVVHDEEK
ncbi:MAG: RDD family protein [Gemmatimonadota bacterium]